MGQMKKLKIFIFLGFLGNMFLFGQNKNFSSKKIQKKEVKTVSNNNQFVVGAILPLRKEGKLIELDAKYVDTGAGLERIVAVLQNKKSNYFMQVHETVFNCKS